MKAEKYSQMMISSSSSSSSSSFFLFFLFFFFLLFFLFFFIWLRSSFSTTLFFILGRLWVSGFLAGPLSEPFGQFGLGTLQPFLVFLLPTSLKMFSSDNFPSTFIQLTSVFIGPGICSAFIFGVHADLGWVFASKCFRIETLFHGLLSQLLFLSFLELFEVIVLSLLSLLKIVFFCFEPDNGFPQFLSFGLQFISVHSIDIQRFDPDGQGDSLLFFELFFGLGHLLPGILNIGATSTDSSLASFARGLLFFLLGLHHFLAFLLSLFQTLAFFLLFCGSFFSFSFSQLLFFFLLLLSQFLFLFSSDLLIPLAVWSAHKAHRTQSLCKLLVASCRLQV